MNALAGMTQAQWSAMAEEERKRLRDLSGLSPQLVGLEGWRVEVETTYGETRRFIVSRSTGWRPCHIELKTIVSSGGFPAEARYAKVRRLHRAR
jgi:hypothetical protein